MTIESIVAIKIPFIARIENCYETLPPNGRKVANYLQQNPLDVLNMSVADIAKTTQTSKATVSRFFRQLGYESHLDLKQELRKIRATGYPLTAQAHENDHVNAELERIRQTWENIKPEDIEQLADDILAASRITLIGFRNSYPIALHFRQQLLQLRNGVRLLPQPGQTLGEEILDIDDNELVILIGFRRRPKIFSRLVDQLANRKVVLLGDPSAQIYTSKVHHLFICQLGKELPLDSYATPMSVVSVICNTVLTKSLASSNDRVNNVSALYDDLEELE